MLFSVHHHFMASLGSNNFVLSLKVWIQKTDATSDKKIENAVRSLFSFLLLADAYSEGNTRMEGVLNIQQNADKQKFGICCLSKIIEKLSWLHSIVTVRVSLKM